MPRSDFNGDGRDDIIFRDSSTGAVMNWLGQPDGSLIYNEASGEDPWASGTLVGIGDFNSDGRSDTLWRDSYGGLNLSYTFAEGAFYFNWSLGFVAPVATSWSVAGIGDFNGDGRDDILWRNGSGDLTNWLSQTSDYGFAKNAAASVWVPTGWTVVGISDFNGDGRDDILWRNDDGQLTDWLGQAYDGFASNPNASVWVPTSWQIAGTGDFNGDGRDDILWRNDDGQLTNWLGQPDGSFANNPNASVWVSTSWHIAATGDFNGDGRDDILWRNDSGDLTNWLGQTDGSFANNANASTWVPTNWYVQMDILF